MDNATSPEIGMARLKATLEKLKTLNESAFNYAEFIQKFDSEKMCPTIGCVAGYLPIWFSDTPFSYMDIQADPMRCEYVLIYENSSSMNIRWGLQKYYGCSRIIIEALFFGDFLENFIGVTDTDTASLRDVQLRFQTVIDLVETSTISWN